LTRGVKDAPFLLRPIEVIESDSRITILEWKCEHASFFILKRIKCALDVLPHGTYHDKGDD
jgi:hypothetical protein